MFNGRLFLTGAHSPISENDAALPSSKDARLGHANPDDAGTDSVSAESRDRSEPPAASSSPGRDGFETPNTEVITEATSTSEKADLDVPNANTGIPADTHSCPNDMAPVSSPNVDGSATPNPDEASNKAPTSSLTIDGSTSPNPAEASNIVPHNTGTNPASIPTTLPQTAETHASPRHENAPLAHTEPTTTPPTTNSNDPPVLFPHPTSTHGRVLSDTSTPLILRLRSKRSHHLTSAVAINTLLHPLLSQQISTETHSIREQGKALRDAEADTEEAATKLERSFARLREQYEKRRGELEEEWKGHQEAREELEGRKGRVGEMVEEVGVIERMAALEERSRKRAAEGGEGEGEGDGIGKRSRMGASGEDDASVGKSSM